MDNSRFQTPLFTYRNIPRREGLTVEQSLASLDRGVNRHPHLRRSPSFPRRTSEAHFPTHPNLRRRIPTHANLRPPRTHHPTNPNPTSPPSPPSIFTLGGAGNASIAAVWSSNSTCVYTPSVRRMSLCRARSGPFSGSLRLVPDWK